MKSSTLASTITVHNQLVDVQLQSNAAQRLLWSHDLACKGVATYRIVRLPSHVLTFPLSSFRQFNVLVDNHRGISLFSVAGKVLARTMLIRLSDHVASTGILLKICHKQ